MAQKVSSSLSVLLYKGKVPASSRLARSDVVLETMGDGHFKVVKSRFEKSIGQVYPNGYMSIYLGEQQEIKNGTTAEE